MPLISFKNIAHETECTAKCALVRFNLNSASPWDTKLIFRRLVENQVRMLFDRYQFVPEEKNQDRNGARKKNTKTEKY